MNKNTIESFAKECYGCRSCEQCCPKSAITIEENEEGFLYPIINDSLCVNCGICVQKCPINIELSEMITIPTCYALQVKDKMLLARSTSGGVFAGIAKELLLNKWTIYGATISEQNRVYHTSIVSTDELVKLQGSKYVASNTGNSFKEIRELLNYGKKVLFSGTPCQIAGLKAYLGKEYENLLTIELICHGVPSQKLFSLYIDWLERNNKYKVIKYNFRNKEKGWNCGGNVNIVAEKKGNLLNINIPGECDPFMYSFLHRSIQRESCYSCKFMDIRRNADLTIGDFWRIEKIFTDLDVSEGYSICLLNTKKGKDIFNSVKNSFYVKEVTLEQAKLSNSHLYEQSYRPEERENTYLSIKQNYFNEKDFAYENKVKYQIKRVISLLLPKKIKEIVKRFVK